MTITERLRRLLTRASTVVIGQAPVSSMFGAGLVGNTGSWDRMLRSNIGWVYKAVQRRGQDLAACDPVAQMQTSQGEFRELPASHPLVRLLRKPNPMETGFEWRWRLQQILDLTGNAYVLKIANITGTQTVELWVLDTRYMRILVGDDGLVKGYEYQLGTKTWSLPTDSVIHIRYPNPGSLIYGLSPLAAAAYEVDIDLLVKEHQRAFLKNAPTPRLAIEADGYLLPDTIASMREQIMTQHMGRHQGSPVITHQGARIKVLDLSPQEINYLSTRENMRDELLAVYGVPSSILGLSKDINRANAEANHYSYALYTLEPLARLRDEVLTARLVGEFGPDLRITHANLVPSNRQEDREDTAMLLANGVTSINEERTYRGWPAIPGGDEPTLQAGRIPLTQIGVDPLASPKSASTTARAAQGSDELIDVAQDVEVLKKSAARSAYWASFAAMHAPNEKRTTVQMKRYFAAQAKEVLSRLRKTVNSLDGAVVRDGTPLSAEAVSFSMDEWNDIITELGMTEVMRTMPDSWKWALEHLGRDMAFDYSRETIKHILQVSIERLKDVNVTTQRALMASIEEGIKNNEGIDKLSERVTQIYEMAAGARAIRIARTLTTQATNASLGEAWKRNSDLVKGKGWLSARDAHVRKPDGKSRYDHASPDGQEVGMSQLFIISGEELAHPGDPRGSAGNIINCRCAMYPVLASKPKA